MLDQDLLDLARTEALTLQHKYIRTEHVILAILKRNPQLDNAMIDYSTLHRALENLSVPTCGAEAAMVPTPTVLRALGDLPADSADDACLDRLLQYAPLVRLLWGENERLHTSHES